MVDSVAAFVVSAAGVSEAASVVASVVDSLVQLLAEIFLAKTSMLITLVQTKPALAAQL